MEGRCRHVLTAQFALHPTRIVSPSLHGAHCMRPQVEAQRLSLQDCCRRAPLAKAHPWVLLCSCGSPGCRPPPPPHRPDCGLPPPLDSPPPAAPPACSCAIHMPLSRLSALLGRFPPISPNVCTGAQRHHLPQADLTRPRRGEAVIAVQNHPFGLGGRCGATAGGGRFLVADTWF